MSDMVKMAPGSVALDREIASLDELISTPAPSAASNLAAPGKASGRIEDAWSISSLGKIRSDWTAEGYNVIPDGHEELMPAGSAAWVLDGYSLLSCHFPQGGRLRGPLIWRSIKSHSDEILLDQGREQGETSPAGRRRWFWATIYLCVAVISTFVLEAIPDGQNYDWGVMSIWGAFTIAAFAGTGALNLWSYKKHPLAIASVNQRISGEARMAYGLLAMLQGGQSPRQAAPVSTISHSLDPKVASSLQSYQAQRQRLAVIGLPCNKMVDHTAVMLDNLAQRLQAVPHNAELQQTFVNLVERAEAEVVRLIERKEAREVEALEGDMKALLTQIERHPT